MLATARGRWRRCRWWSEKETMIESVRGDLVLAMGMLGMRCGRLSGQRVGSGHGR